MLLGVAYGLHVSMEEKFEHALTRFQLKMCHWGKKHLSLAGKVLAVNQVLSASVWYFASAQAPSLSQLRRLRQLIAAFVWGASSHQEHPSHLASWAHITMSKQDGGLGFLTPASR